MKSLALEKRKLDEASWRLAVRRLNWRVETRRRIIDALERTAAMAEEVRYGFRFNVGQYGEVNDEAIQLNVGWRFIGIREQVSDGERIKVQHHTEKGGCLVFSQNLGGRVAILMYPLSSERYKTKEDCITFKYNLDPTDLTPKLIEKAMRRFLIYLRYSSVVGLHDDTPLRERLLIAWMIFWDARNRYALSRSLMDMSNEWAKIITASLLALAVGLYIK